MKELVDLILSRWLCLTLVVSSFWGFRSAFLFTNDPSIGRSNRIFFLRKKCPCLASFFIAAYQFAFNFVGSVAGWACLYLLLIRAQQSSTLATHLSWSDVGLFALSVLGLTGHLPQAIYGVVSAADQLAATLIKKLA